MRACKRNGLPEEEWGIFDNDIINNGPEEYVMTWLAIFLRGGGERELRVWGDTIFYEFYL